MISQQGDTFITNEVISIEEVQIDGFAAPLTGQGNLIANGIVVSCYAKIKN